jgi:hypothetical protein
MSEISIPLNLEKPFRIASAILCVMEFHALVLGIHRGEMHLSIEDILSLEAFCNALL